MHGNVTARDYVRILGDQFHPLVHCFLRGVPFNKKIGSPFHAALSIQSWFEKLNVEVYHLPSPPQLPDLHLLIRTSVVNIRE